ASREHLCLGPKNGFASSFGHVEMLISKAAQRDVWPLLVDWLQRQNTASASVAASAERETLC
ncbi:MAG TPA: alpha/beta hydrolase, partial [Pseudomonas sp.]|nr:alpha/beta hydrolase [Pseudomonas sp.]